MGWRDGRDPMFLALTQVARVLSGFLPWPFFISTQAVSVQGPHPKGGVREGTAQS